MAGLDIAAGARTSVHRAKGAAAQLLCEGDVVCEVHAAAAATACWRSMGEGTRMELSVGLPCRNAVGTRRPAATSLPLTGVGAGLLASDASPGWGSGLLRRRRRRTSSRMAAAASSSTAAPAPPAAAGTTLLPLPRPLLALSLLSLPLLVLPPG